MRFTKMHGIGNDYVYVDCFDEPLAGVDLSDLSRRVAHRRFGIGSDGLILIMPGEQGCDFRMRIFNADGSEGDMCGNGMRCVARYVYDHGRTRKKEFTVLTRAGVMRPTVITDDAGRVTGVRVNLGQPSLTRGRMLMAGDPSESTLRITVTAGDRQFVGTGVAIGNPNYVIEVDDAASFPIEKYGSLLENHPIFPQRTNVEFVTPVARDRIVMRVWERGSGITWACGTGASASLVAMAAAGRTDREATVSLLGGDLRIEWGDDGNVYMTGPAEEVFTGEYPITEVRRE